MGKPTANPPADETANKPSLSDAMAAADAAGDAARPEAEGTALQATSEAEAALEEPIGRPVVTTHSTALARQFEGISEGIVAQVNDIDAKIDLLQAEREDLMLAHSMLSHGMSARERGRRG